MAETCLCLIPDCGKPAINSRGWCWPHYQRWRRHGDPNKLLKIPNGTAQEFYREVVLAFDGEGCLFWPFAKNPNGYAVLGQKQLHRIVCEDEHGPPPSKSHQAAHSCGKGHLGCVSRHHLRWATPVENNADKLVHGTHQRGEMHGNAKITSAQAQQIMALKGHMSQPDIAARFGVARTTVNNIHNGTAWAWLF